MSNPAYCNDALALQAALYLDKRDWHNAKQVGSAACSSCTSRMTPVGSDDDCTCGACMRTAKQGVISAAQLADAQMHAWESSQQRGRPARAMPTCRWLGRPSAPQRLLPRCWTGC